MNHIIWALPGWVHNLIVKCTGWYLIKVTDEKNVLGRLAWVDVGERIRSIHFVWSGTYPLEEPCQQVCSTQSMT